MLVLLVIGPAILEEVLYRGLLQRGLREWKVLGGWGAIVATSGIFVFMHAPIVPAYALPPLFILSLGLGWCYEKTGRLLAPMVLHGLFNAGNLALALGASGPV
jgi:membrane protease YdiL (CAAX protease family)